MSAWLGGWRSALRVARREARRARGRSVLVVAMIALPVAALAFAAVYRDTFTLSPAERADRLMGAAQAAVTWPFHRDARQDPLDPDGFASTAPPPREGEATPAPTTERLLALLPPGSRAVTDQVGQVRVRTAAGAGDLDARMLDLTDPLARGILRPLAGRPPAAAGEVALTPAAAGRVGTGVGGTLRLAGDGRAFRVVGLVEDPASLTAATVVLRPGALPPEALSTGSRPGPIDRRWLVATAAPITWARVKELNTHGVVALSRHVLAHPPSRAERYPEFAGGQGFAPGAPGFVGGLAMLEVILLAGPAFAVGARRRRRDLALVAAAGGNAAQLRRIVLADGMVLGAVAAAGGLVLGVAAAAAARPLLEEHLVHARSGAFRVLPPALGALAALAVATGLLAALVPAWIAGRQEVVAGLAGRRGITRSRRRWIALGALLAAAGAAVVAAGARRGDATTILAGLAAGELGLALCTPAMVGLVARLGGWLPLAPRVALRDTARNRTAAAPAISAVMAAVVGSLAVGVMLTADTERTRDDYRSLTRTGDVVLDHTGKGPGNASPVPARAVDLLRRSLPVEQVHQLGLPRCGPGDCLVVAQVSPARSCPYSPEVLRRDPNAAEQRAARRDPRCDGVRGLYRYFQHLISDNFTLVVDDTAVGALTGLGAEDAARAAAALRGGAVVVDHPRYLDDRGRVTLRITDSQPTAGVKEGDSRVVTARGFAPAHHPRAPVVLMTRQTARSLGLDSVAALTLATTGRMPTVAESDRLQAALGNQVGVYVERGAQPGSDERSLLLLTVVAGLITLGAAAIATGLAAADGRADLSTLAAVAPPRGSAGRCR